MPLELPKSFGTRAGDYTPPERTYDENDIWIKGFKEGKHRLRILQPVVDFKFYWEHYDANLGDKGMYYPCTEIKTSCVGCQHKNEKVRKGSPKYAFNALDENGNLGVYKIGRTMFDEMKMAAEDVDIAEDITAQDVFIVRQGSDFSSTSYSYKLAGRPYPIDFDGELHNLDQVLSSKYVEAYHLYEEAGLADDEGTYVDEASIAPSENTKIKAGSKAKAEVKADDSPSTSTAVGLSEEYAEPVDDWGTAKIKRFLTEHDVDFPKNGSRDVLVPLVNVKLKELIGY